MRRGIQQHCAVWLHSFYFRFLPDRNDRAFCWDHEHLMEQIVLQLLHRMPSVVQLLNDQAALLRVKHHMQQHHSVAQSPMHTSPCIVTPRVPQALEDILLGWVKLHRTRARSADEQLALDEAVRHIATAIRLFGVEPNLYLSREEQEQVKWRILG